MPLPTSYDNLIARVSGNFDLSNPIYGENQTSPVNPGGNLLFWNRIGYTKKIPSSLPSGVTGVVPTLVSVISTRVGSVLVGVPVYMGSLNIATNTFTSANSMPTVTEGNASNATYSMLIFECDTALNASPGNLTVTYVDQDGNASETTSNQALGASAPKGSAGLVLLNAGDIGVRSISNAQQNGGSSPTGTLKFYGVKPLGIMLCSIISQLSDLNLLTERVNVMQLDGTANVNDGVALWFISATAATGAITGTVTYVGVNSV